MKWLKKWKELQWDIQEIQTDSLLMTQFKDLT